MCLYVLLLDAKEVLFTLILNVIYWGGKCNIVRLNQVKETYL